ncbi:helix-turn-helix domain-containing protein [Exiguobacterium sp. s48]|uniref:helix-turn-helix domain-containing protein n=1 Tax=Exiguobacterium sp. s48 TaxID=2751273 RepID=UPI001BE6A834|nr:helix-turn-helix domain-containing protein [Exiguobacterium sp. s48]
MKRVLRSWGEQVELNEAIVERMKELAAEHNMTIHQVIQKGGLNQATISELMNGRTKHPKISTIQKFCNGVDISLNKFFDSEKFKF